MTDEQLEPIHHVYYGFDRKPCQVLVDGIWCDAEIRSWNRDQHGAWTAAVMWSTGPGQGNHLGRFPDDRVQPVLEAGPLLPHVKTPGTGLRCLTSRCPRR